MQALETSTMSDDEYMSTGDLNDDDEDYRPRASPVPTVGPLLPVKQQKKRGRKPNPNPSIRTAREAARKANHSVIEKKRREKINQALTELRTLVPADDPMATVSTSKDFKLEVLVRTVTHLKMLVGRVHELESAAAASGDSSKRPRSAAAAAAAAHCQCSMRERGTSYETHSPRIELPPVSSILTGLPSPPSSGSLAISTVTSEVPSLHLPGSSIAMNTSGDSPSLSPLSLRHPFHEQVAAYSLLHMSSRQQGSSASKPHSAETPRSILGMSPLLPAQGRRI